MNSDSLRRLVEMVLGASTWDETVAIIENNPVLLSTAVDEPLAYLIDAARRDGDVARGSRVQALAKMLRAAREVGPRAAVAALANPQARDESPFDAGLDYFSLYRSSGDAAMLDAAIERWDADLKRVPPWSAERAVALNNVVVGLMERFKRSGRQENLDQAIETAEAAVQATPPDAAQRATRLSNWAAAVLLRYQTSHRVEDLDKALPILREATDTTAPASLERALCLHNLSAGYLLRYQLLGQPADLDATIEAAREAVALTPPGSVDYTERQDRFAIALERRFLDRDDIRSLDQALRAWQEAIDGGDPRAPIEVDMLFSYGRALWRRQALRHAPQDRAAAVVTLALAFIYGRDDAGRLLDDLFAAGAEEADPAELDAVVSRLRFESANFKQTGNVISLDAARRGWPLALAHPALVGEARASGLIEAGFVYWDLFHARGDIADLDAAVDAFEEAVALTQADSPNLTRRRNNLAVALNERGHAADLSRGIELLEAILAGEPPTDIAPGIRTNLARMMVRRAEKKPDTRPLVQALELLDEAWEELPEDSPERIDTGVTRAGTRLELYDRVPRAADLDRAQAELEELVAQTDKAGRTSEADKDRLRALSLLASALEKRYDRSEDPKLLDRAVKLVERAADIAHGTPRAPVLLEQLGILRSRRAEALDRFSEFDRAVEALTAASDAAPERPGRLAMLAEAKLRRAMHRKDAVEHAEALELLRQAMERMPGGSAERRGVAQSLAIGWSVQPGNPERLDDAITAARDAAAPRLTSVLGTMLFQRYRRDGSRDDLDAAIDNLAAAEDGDRLMLAHALSERYRLTRDGADRAVAAEIFAELCRSAANSRTRLLAARGWARLETDEGEWRAAAEPYRAGLAALGRIEAAPGLRVEREGWLGQARGFAAEAAFGLSMAGDRTSAVEAIERNRALLLTDVLQRRRFDLETLRSVGRGELARRYELAAERLGKLEDAEIVGDADARSTPGPARSASADEIVAAREGLDAVMDEIRSVAGFQTLFDPPGYNEIAQLAGDTPLVYLCSGQRFGIALIANADAPPPLLLPYLTDERVAAGVSAYFAAYAARAERPDLWRAQLDHTLKWLWAAAIGPLVSADAMVGPVNGTGLYFAGRSAVVLVPCGSLALLPLHAAWTSDEDRQGGRRYALDELCISYAPNARLLAEARRRVQAAAAPHLLAVEDPRPVSAPPLPGTAAEVGAAIRAFPGARVLRRERATRAAVVQHLGQHTIAHLACHGQADPGEPLDSFLLLAGDERLGVRDLMARQFPDLRLAVLSACETAAIGRELPDEMIGLPAGLLQAGAAGVLASGWSVPDDSTSMLLTRFYQLWDGIAPAEALRAAQQWMRDSSNGEKLALVPDLMTPVAERVPVRARSLWEGAHGHRHPYHWAGFAYVGA